ncbi:MAG: sigma-70 family RNA polymerase sigma factor [Planctomycetota bacterium]|nr:sigma-70 family RNA polymerase sigma factor [Planctomycetota bacterium]
MRNKPDPDNPAGTETTEPSEHADSELVKKSLQGDLDSFEVLIERYQQAVYNIAYYKSRNYFDAEDLAQDIFLAAFKALPTLKDINKFSSWLFGIAYNRCHKWFQRERTKIVKFKEISRQLSQQQRMERLKSGQPGTRFAGEEPEIAEFLHKLPGDVKNVLKLKYLEGMSYDEISDKLDIKPHRIDYLIRKGKKLIRERWSQRDRKADDKGAS